MGKRLSFEERLTRHVVVDGDCWIWTGSRTRREAGYGQTRVGGRLVPAHRWTYEVLVGPIPQGLTLDHYACERTLCVNPDHVRPASQRENILRGHGLAAQNLAKTHCPQGHPYDDGNTYWMPNGAGRDCKICINRRSRERNARRRAARVAA